MLTIEGRSDASRRGRAAAVTRNTPSTLTRITRCQSARLHSSIVPTWPIPALLTRMSSDSTRPSASSTLSGLETSRWRELQFSISAASERAESSLMSAIRTLAPLPARARTVCSPMPLPPPVTSAVLPSRRNGLFADISEFHYPHRMIGAVRRRAGPPGPALTSVPHATRAVARSRRNSRYSGA